MRLRLLRLFLGAAAFGWVIMLAGVFMSWSAACFVIGGGIVYLAPSARL